MPPRQGLFLPSPHLPQITVTLTAVITPGIACSPGTLWVVSSSGIRSHPWWHRECFRVCFWAVVWEPNSFSLAQKQNWSCQWTCHVFFSAQVNTCSQCSCVAIIIQHESNCPAANSKELKEAFYILVSFFFLYCIAHLLFYPVSHAFSTQLGTAFVSHAKTRVAVISSPMPSVHITGLASQDSITS